MNLYSGGNHPIIGFGCWMFFSIMYVFVEKFFRDIRLLFMINTVQT
jgi:hypothetical protein